MRLFLPFLLLFSAFFYSFHADAQISISQSGIAYKQNFDTLDNTAGDSSAVMPPGWYFYKPFPYSQVYKVDSGALPTANVYSYGGKNNQDRALGTLGSSSLSPIIGASFKNNTGGDITSIKFKFTVEQWRYGGGASARSDSSVCEISFFASSIGDPFGFWSPVNVLNLKSIVTYANGGTAKALNGNDPANQQVISYTVTGITIPNGTVVWVRWRDINRTNNDGLAIDNFELIANPGPPTVSFVPTALKVPENGDSVKVTLHIANPGDSASTVSVAADPKSTATQGQDFSYNGGKYTFPGGSSDDVSFWVKILDDNIYEGNETVILKLRDPSSGVTLGDSVLTITILDNDHPDRHFTIRQIRQNDSNYEPDSLSKHVILKGIVSSPNLTNTGLNFYFYDSTGAINVYSPVNTFGYNPKVGDSVNVDGVISFISGLTTVSFLGDASDTVMRIGNNSAAVTPETANTKPGENTESHLVSVANLHILNPSQWKNNGSNFTINAFNGRDTITLFISSTTNASKMKMPEGIFDLQGIVSQVDNSSPYNSGYLLIPRSSADFIQIPVRNISVLKALDASGLALNNHQLTKIKAIVESRNFSSSGLDFFVFDASGDINISAAKNYGYTPAPGDSIEAEGTIISDNGVVRLVPTAGDHDTLWKISSGNPIQTALTVTWPTEGAESRYLIIRNVHMADKSKWFTNGRLQTDVVSGSDTFQLLISSNSDLNNSPAPKGNFNIYGYGWQQDSTSPYFSGYALRIYSKADIIPQKPQFVKIRQLRANDANGVPLMLDSLVTVKGIVTSRGANFREDGLEISIEDSTGAVMVNFAGKDFGYKPVFRGLNYGDSVSVTGKVGFEYGLTEINLSGTDYDTIYKFGLDTFFTPEFKGVLSEGMESLPVLDPENHTIVDNTEWQPLNPEGFIVRYRRAASQDTIRIVFTKSVLDQYSTYFSKNPQLYEIAISGICVQVDSTSPYKSNYVIFIRDSLDLYFPESIHELIKPSSITIYPNPLSSETLRTDYSGPAVRYTITNVTGQEVISGYGDAREINTGQLPSGTYILRMTSNKFTGVGRFIKL